MSTGLRIAEMAARSGFSPATLRYYEDIGLLPPPARSPSGYREYDERTLDRLAFIARAKQLGCTLEEIADLSIAWDGGQCGPVQERLRAAVAAKLDETHERIVELIALAADLQRSAAALQRHRADGPCDARCGCIGEPESTTTGVALVSKPVAPDDPAIACTLDAASMAERTQDWRWLLDFVVDRSAIDSGVRLELDEGAPIESFTRLAHAEHACCRFLSFALTIDRRGVGLEIRARQEALPVVLALFGAGT